MKQIATVFSYTLKEGVRKKAFLISTVIIMAVILLLCLAPRVISVFQGDDQQERAAGSRETAGTESPSEETSEEAVQGTDEVKDGICYFIDETGIFAEHFEVFEALYPDWKFETAKRQDMDSLKEDIAENEKLSMVSIEEAEGVPFIRVVNTNFMKGVSGEKIADACSRIWQAERLKASSLSQEEIAAAQTVLNYTEESAGEMDLTGYILGLVMTFIMFFAVYYYGYGVAMSVASEKTSRVMETLIISAKPSRILIGKCLAMGVLGLLQLTGLLVFGLLCSSLLLPEGFQIGGVPLSLNGFTPQTILLLVLYFVLGYALYAVLNSVCGAAVSKVEDLNSAMMPVSLVAILGFYLGYFTSVMGGGSSALSVLAVYLPISSPFAVPFKILTGEITGGELAGSIGILAASIIVVAAVSSKIYSASVMHYGNKLKWKDMKNIKTN